MNPDDVRKRFEKELPGHTVEVIRFVSTDFKPQAKIIVDGNKTLSVTWDLEMIQDLKTLHGVSAEEEVFQSALAEIKQLIK